MIYWILSAFLGVLVLVNSPLRHDVQVLEQQQQSPLTFRAIQTVRYMNLINDWRYDNPGFPDGVVPDSTLDWSSVPGLQNLIAGGRTWVYQPAQPGLMTSLLTQTHQSALVGHVVNRRLIDSQGNDMQVSVPDNIANDSLVWLN